MTNLNLTIYNLSLLVETGTPHKAMNLTIHSKGTLTVAPLITIQDHRNYGPDKLRAYLHVSSSACEDGRALDDTVMESFLRSARWAIAESAFFYVDQQATAGAPDKRRVFNQSPAF